MPRFARLFEAAEDILDAYREAMKRGDADSVLRLWLDEDSVSCITPDGQRLMGHEQLRQAFTRLLQQRPLWIEVIDVESHASLGVSIFRVTEALRVNESATEADLFVHTTYILLQNHEGWRIAHIHCSTANQDQLAQGVGGIAYSLH
jgi:uncharacterized protein (TIGR02246 family)